MIKDFFESLKGKKVDKYKQEISERNYKCFRGFAIVGALVSPLILIFGLLLSNFVTFNLEFLIIFCYFMALILLSELVLKKHHKHITLIYYIVLSPLMAMGILMGTFSDPTQPSITIMVFICVLTLFVIDKPWRIILYITVVSFIYVICCDLAKDNEMFKADMVDLVIFFMMSVALNIFILNDRIKSVENFLKFKEKSETDLMTGVLNRVTGIEQIEEKLKNNSLGAFILLDVDDFKLINDTCGHVVGDNVLSSIVSVIKDSFSKDDIFLRMGGDEFAVFTSFTTKEELLAVAENIILKLNNLKFCNCDKPISISLGCALVKNNEDFEMLYKTSDDCLYQAKREGKGKCVIA